MSSRMPPRQGDSFNGALLASGVGPILGRTQVHHVPRNVGLQDPVSSRNPLLTRIPLPL